MDIVELNVGGRIFATTRTTLCKDANSMLAAMFSGDLRPAHTDKEARYFIDRNGELFAVVIAFLRGEPQELPAFGIQRQALAAEAQFTRCMSFLHFARSCILQWADVQCIAFCKITAKRATADSFATETQPAETLCMNATVRKQCAASLVSHELCHHTHGGLHTLCSSVLLPV